MVLITIIDIIIDVVIIAIIIPVIIAIIIPHFIKRRKAIKKYYSIVWKKTSSLIQGDLIGLENFYEYYYERSEDKKILECLTQNNNILLIGRQLCGKTRAIYEVLKKVSFDITMLSRVDIELEDFCIPLHRKFWKPRIVIIDDLHRFVEKKNFEYLIDRVLKKSIPIVASCRLNQDFEIFKQKLEDLHIDLNSSFNTINLKDISEDKAREIAKIVKTNWDNIKFNGTVGSIFTTPKEKSEVRFKFDSFNIYDFESILQDSEVIPFRPDGPKIPDFENADWVFVPITAERIYKAVQKGNIVILGGKPATGKSVISRYVGFKSMKNLTHPIYYIDFLNLNLKEKEALLDDLNLVFKNPKFKNFRIDKLTPLFIFENVHDPELDKLQYDKKNFIDSLKALNGKLKVLITTRGDISKESPYSWIKEKHRINLNKLPSLNKEIINGILQKVNIKREKFDLEPINWEPYDEIENLWLLGWILRIIELSRNQKFLLIDQNSTEFKKAVLKYYENNFDFSPKKLLAVMLILSILSIYEIYMEEDFILSCAIKEFEGLSPQNTKEILNQLLENHEILHKEIVTSDISMDKFEYRIPHIRLAEIFHELFADEKTIEKIDLILNKYSEQGNNTSKLGDYLWEQKEFKKAIKCFKLVEKENLLLETFLNNYQVVPKVKDNRIVNLNLSHNELNEIPKGLDGFSEIRELRIGSNNIQEINGLNKLVKLEILDLSHNKIKEIIGLNRLINLKIIDLSYNPIEKIKNLGKLSKLEIFNLRGTKISKIENLHNCLNLRLLDLRDNNIYSIIGLENLPNLRVIDLSENKILNIKGIDKLTNVEIIKPQIDYKALTEGYIGYQGLTLEYGSSYTFKIMMLGDGGVGKTSFTKRFCYNLFNPSERLTIGVDFHTKTLEFENSKIKLQLWDVGGEEKFRFLLPEYCRGSSGAFLLYDITDPGTLDNLVDWVRILRGIAGDVPIILVGSKVDLEDYRVVTREEAIYKAEQLKFTSFVEISSKLGINIDAAFNVLFKSLFRQV